jgi:hypothetical protein
MGRRSGVLMIALLPLGVDKLSDEHFADGADHAKANWVREKGPVEVGLGATMWFQLRGGRGGTVVR